MSFSRFLAAVAVAALAAGPVVAESQEKAASGADAAAGKGHAHHHGHGHEAAHAGLPGDAPLPGRSIYQLEGQWSKPGGERFALADLRGRPVLVLLFYGTCQSACPVLVRDLQRIDAQLSAEERAGVRYLLVSFDPAVDTPERLAAYAKEHSLASDRWTLASGTPDQVREIAAVLGVNYRPTGDGHYSHTQRITILDRDGVVAESFDGMDRPIEPIAARAKQEIEKGEVRR